MLRFDNREHLPDNKNDVIFIHIPKTGGTSIVKSVMDGSLTRHSSAIAYKGYDEEAFNRSYKFSVIRNPLDRSVSTYHYSKQRNKGCSVVDGSNSFKDFCENLRDNFYGHVSPGFLPQVFWVTDEFCRVIIDDIFPFDLINESMEYVIDKAKLNSNFAHLNKSRHKPFMDYHTDETIKILRELYPMDFFLYESVLDKWSKEFQ